MDVTTTNHNNGALANTTTLSSQYFINFTAPISESMTLQEQYITLLQTSANKLGKRTIKLQEQHFTILNSYYASPNMYRLVVTAFDGNRVIGLPTLQSNVNLEYDLAAVEGLTVTGDIIHTGARYADAANSLKVDGYTTLDVGARYKTMLAGQDVTLKGVVTNVTGEDYWQSVGGYAGAGYLNASETTALKVSATFDF